MPEAHKNTKYTTLNLGNFYNPPFSLIELNNLEHPGNKKKHVKHCFSTQITLTATDSTNLVCLFFLANSKPHTLEATGIVCEGCCDSL